jgi:hypothetical protein
MPLLTAQAFSRSCEATAAVTKRLCFVGKKPRSKKKISNLTRALADGYSPAITADLSQLEEQLDEIRQRVEASRPEALQIRIRDTRRFVESRLADLQALFAAEPVTIRTEIATHVQKSYFRPKGARMLLQGHGI